MREVVFTMELRGRVESVQGKKNTFKAQLSGRNFWGEHVTFESHVVLQDETFSEVGHIDYRGRGKLTFETVGSGYLGPSPILGLQRGSVIWRITEGEGDLTGAEGYITSNFTLSAEGDVVDNQCIRLFVPN